MFRTNEGLSTYLVSRFVKQLTGQKSFISIEYDPEHIQLCKQILGGFDSALLSEVQFLCGNSLEMLPKALEQMQSVNFALLDGGAAPECCLREFELVIQKLSKNGLIVIDDLQDMAATPAYPFPRPFGKATLILPYLVVAEYLRIHDERNAQNKFDSGLVADSSSSTLARFLKPLNYNIVSQGNHKMMLVGNHSVLDVVTKKLRNTSASIQIAPVGSMTETPAENTGVNSNIVSSGQKPVKNLEMFRDKFAGRRAFIIGNGPSLNKVDLTKLKNEITFGVNSIFYNFDRMGFKPTFYVVEDKLVAEDRADVINKLTGMVKISALSLNTVLKTVTMLYGQT
jgi:hypothetical protein